jgi:hypothetical protein
MLSFLYKDVAAIIKTRGLVDLGSSLPDKVILSLQDMNNFLTSSSRRKLLFYGAYWLHLSQKSKSDLASRVDEETKRLQAELDKAEDEERFLAVNEAVAQQGVLVPS